MKPSFLRLPGGNFLEGNTIAERFDWKTNHWGHFSQRPGHPDPWGYQSSDGYGLLEYLEWCEDLHMKTVLAVFAGYALGGEYVPAGPGLGAVCPGRFGRNRVRDRRRGYKMGRGSGEKRSSRAVCLCRMWKSATKTFFDKSGSYEGRFAQFYDAIHAKYPHLQIIATMSVKSRKPDVLDDHFYRSAAEFEADFRHYDGLRPLRPENLCRRICVSGRHADPEPQRGARRRRLYDRLRAQRRRGRAGFLCSRCWSISARKHLEWGVNLIGFDALRKLRFTRLLHPAACSAFITVITTVPATLTGGSGLAYCASKVSRDGNCLP